MYAYIKHVNTICLINCGKKFCAHSARGYKRKIFQSFIFENFHTPCVCDLVSQCAKVFENDKHIFQVLIIEIIPKIDVYINLKTYVKNQIL